MNGSQSCSGSPLSERDRVVDGLLATSSFVGEPLALCADERAVGASFVVDAELDAVVVAEIEFGQIPINVFPIDVLIDTDQAALEDGEEAFERVGMNVIPDVLALGMIDAGMLPDEMTVDGRAVGVEPAVTIKVLPERTANAIVVEEYRADRAAALNKAQHLPILAGRRVFRTAGFRRTGDKGLVGFDDLAGTADRSGAAAAVHRQPDTVHKEPRGFHAAAERALYLAGRDAFLAGANQVHRLEPDMQRHMARFEDRPHPHGKGLPAGAAFPQTRARALALECRRFADRTAMRANGAIGPELSFNIGNGGLLIAKMRSTKGRFHG